jgi:hypothetical protein
MADGARLSFHGVDYSRQSFGVRDEISLPQNQPCSLSVRSSSNCSYTPYSIYTLIYCNTSTRYSSIEWLLRAGCSRCLLRGLKSSGHLFSGLVAS